MKRIVLLSLCLVGSMAMSFAQQDSEIRIEGSVTMSSTEEKMDSLTASEAAILNQEIVRRLTKAEEQLGELESKRNSLSKQDKKELSTWLREIDEELDHVDDNIDNYEAYISPILIERYDDAYDDYRELKREFHPIIRKERLPNVKTRWLLFDLGFTTYTENSTPPTVDGLDPTSSRLGKSVAVTIHIFQQRLNLVDHNLNLLYGLGIHSATYAFDGPLVLLPDQPQVTFEHKEGSVRKNRLRANYLHIPLLLNYESNPVSRKSFRLSAGPYMNILYGSNVKTKIDGNKTKTKNQFNLNRFSPGLYAEIGIGIVNLYGTYSFVDLFDKDEDGGYELTPIGFGIKLIPF